MTRDDTQHTAEVNGLIVQWRTQRERVMALMSNKTETSQQDKIDEQYSVLITLEGRIMACSSSPETAAAKIEIALRNAETAGEDGELWWDQVRSALSDLRHDQADSRHA